MNVLDAAHRIGHEHPGGCDALALRMGIKPAVFRAKVNPNADTNHITLIESVRMQHLSGRRDIVIAMADELGGAYVELPAIEDEDVSNAVRKAVAGFGAYMQAVDEALDDSRVTRNEAKRLAAQVTEMIARATHLQALLAGMAERAPK